MEIAYKDIVPLKCISTGKCCAHNLVILTGFDIYALGIALDMSARELFDSKILTYRINRSNFWMEPIINSKEKNICPFLKNKFEVDREKYICGIYENRPTVCRIYPLKFDKEKNIFLRFFPSEQRCFECFDSNSKTTLENYLQESKLDELLKSFLEFDEFIESIASKGMNIQAIKNKKLEQKKFFQIQKIIYETFPENKNFTNYPLEKVKETVIEILATV
jgi:Fe-S-cluster containining protein